MRYFAIITISVVLIAAASVTRAQTVSTCIPLEQSWTRQFPTGTIPYVTYQVPNSLLIITQSRSLKYMNILLNVPQLVANQLNALATADAYIAQIKPQYHEALLNENGCPILYEKTGFFPIWTR